MPLAAPPILRTTFPDVLPFLVSLVEHLTDEELTLVWDGCKILYWEGPNPSTYNAVLTVGETELGIFLLEEPEPAPQP